MTDPIIVVQKSNSTWKIIAAVVVTAIVCLLFVPKCGGGSAKPAVVDVNDSLRIFKAGEKKASKKYADSMGMKNEQIDYGNSVIGETTTMLMQASDEKTITDAKLKDTQRELAKYKALKDTAKILTACDTLSNQVTELQNKSIRADVACKTAIESYQAQSKRKDEALAMQGREVARMKNSLDLLGNTLKLAGKAEKQPWVKGYLGVAASFGGTGMINNFGPELTFVTRKDFLFGVGGKFGNGGVLGEVRIGKMITFKKH